MAATQTIPDETTPVDDVRRVRERIDHETNGSIEALAQQSHAAFERYCESLGLKLVAAPKLPSKPAEVTG